MLQGSFKCILATGTGFAHKMTGVMWDILGKRNPLFSVWAIDVSNGLTIWVKNKLTGWSKDSVRSNIHASEKNRRRSISNGTR